MIYIRRSDGAYASYDGMTIDQIRASLQSMGLSFTVVDAATYTAAIASK